MAAITSSITRPRLMKRELRNTLSAYSFILPWLIGFILFTGGPILVSLVLSFFSWKMIAPPRFVGLDNYTYMFTTDPLFKTSLWVTFKFVIISVPLAQVLALMLALMLNQRIRGVGFWRTVFYLPAIVSGVAGATIWRWMYHGELGIFNNLLELVGIAGTNWLVNKDTVLNALIVKSLWNIGVPMVVYLAALQNMPKELYEAVEIDGGGEIQKFFTITLPMLSPSIFFNVVMGFIGGVQTFTEPYVMTSGGPDNATLFLGLHLYQSAFSYLKMGYASAMAWIMFLIIFVLTLVQFRLGSFWVYYDSAQGS